jgi:hypothetical protein
MPAPIVNHASTATVTEENGDYFLVLGKGDHFCDRWKLSRTLLVKLAYESFLLVFKGI